jgi:hypothetical protein
MITHSFVTWVGEELSYICANGILVPFSMTPTYKAGTVIRKFLKFRSEKFVFK